MTGRQPLLQLEGLEKRFRRAGRQLVALQGVKLDVAAGERVAIVGASGCGKSTLARCVVRLLSPDRGTVRFLGQDITFLSERKLRPLRRDLQLVFQASTAALDPREPIRAAIAEPLICYGLAAARQRERAIFALLDRVGLGSELAGRYPHQLSGGQIQRVCIARALATRPRLLVADEPTSALDAVTRHEIIELLRQTTTSENALIVITHDLRLARQLGQRLVVMDEGQVVEQLRIGELDQAKHPRTRALLGHLADDPIADPSTRDQPR